MVDAPRVVDFVVSVVLAGAVAFVALDEAVSDVVAGAPTLKMELGAEEADAAEDTGAVEDAGANNEGAVVVAPLPRVKGL